MGDTYVFLEEPEPLLETLRKCGTRIDLFTFLQRLPETSPKYPYPMDWDNFAVLPVTTFDHWLKHQIRFAPRGRVRQAEKKGVSTREVAFDETLVRGIWEIYNECPVRQGTAFAHYGRDIQTVRRLEATFLDKSVFIGAFLGDQMIGFAKLTHDETRTQANLMNIVSMVRHSDKCPTNALIAQAVRSCAERKIAYLVYQKFSYGKKGSDGLSQFKKVNGFERIDLPRYYVPLTPWGRAAIRLRLHQPLADRLPQPMVSKLRDLRSAWYNRKLSNLEAS
ncbi:MAG: hypothetical protein ACRD5K_20100 [Candidatus Acidiferrales bacterium]